VNTQRTYSWSVWFGGSGFLEVKVARSLVTVSAIHYFSLVRGDEEGVGMGGEAGSDSGAQSKVLADHGYLTRWNEEMMDVLVAYLSAQSCAARCLRKVNRRKKLQDQARQERKRCQLS
jgi:hypothetical protein